MGEPDLTIRETAHVAAAPAEVYRWFTEPELLLRWFPTEVENRVAKDGDYRFRWQHPDSVYEQRGNFLEVTPGERLRFTWSAIPGGDAVPEAHKVRGRIETVVDVRLRAEGEGTRVELEHSGWLDDEVIEHYRQEHQSGWSFFMGNLRSVLEEGEDLRAKEHGMLVGG